MSKSADQDFEANAIANLIGSLIGGVLAGAMIALLTLATPQIVSKIGWELTYLLWLGFIAGFIALALTFLHYIRVLGGAKARLKSPERIRYETLRHNLGDGGIQVQLYGELLTAFLDKVDRFFRDARAEHETDAEVASRTLLPHFLGLKRVAPLWTAPSFDRCLLLALIYPLAAIFIIWTVSGHVGPAEAALRLPSHLPAWKRAITLSIAGIEILSIWQYILSAGLKSFLWGVVAGAGVVALAGAGAGAFAVAGAVAVAVAGAGAVAGVVAGAGVVALAGAGAGAGAFAVAVAVAVAFAVSWLNDLAERHNRQGRFLSLFLMAMIAACFYAPVLLAHFEAWATAGPLLLFLVLLTALNAPFDWASLGLTRGLLRRGVELGGWAPYWLALLDALLAVIVIALLAATMVIGVQIFDLMAIKGGGKPILPLRPLFDGIAANPRAPEFWWIYALLLSTMIPSLVNLAIGGTSLVRGLPGIPARVLKSMQPRKPIVRIDRIGVALILTSQWAIGTILGVMAQAILLIGIIGYVLPWLGIEFLDIFPHLIFE